MKSERDFRGKAGHLHTADTLKRAVKLDPVKKSGKERHSLYEELEEDSQEGFNAGYRKRESILDYFDE